MPRVFIIEQPLTDVPVVNYFWIVAVELSTTVIGAARDCWGVPLTRNHLRIAGAKDLLHASRAEGGEDLIRAEARAVVQRQRVSRRDSSVKARECRD